MSWLNHNIVRFITFILLGVNPINPLAESNETLERLNNLLIATQIIPIQTSLKPYRNEIEVTFSHHTKHSSLAIFNLDKEVEWQVNALQKTIKVANIKNKTIKIVDFGHTYPYATLKNN